MDQSIGSFTFLELAGRVVFPKPHVEVLTRPGVNATGAFSRGRFGDPFQLRSMVDCESIADAHEVLQQYEATVGMIQALVQDDVNFASAFTMTFLVVGVRCQEIGPLAASSGGLNPPSAAYLKAEWTLVTLQM